MSSDRSRSTRRDAGLRLFHAADLQGSERCWTAFLRAGRTHAADALVLGGGITGRAVMPIERTEAGAYRPTPLGPAVANGSGAALLSTVRWNGFYPLVASRRELERCRADATAREALLGRVLAADVRRWMARADAVMGEDGGAPIYVMAGSEDPLGIDGALASAHRVVHADDAIVDVGGYEMLSCSWAHRTPWGGAREVSEDALYARLRALAERLRRPRSAIFNLHAPPYDSGLDCADGAAQPAGSRAVRQLIEELQPLLALHGRIHESPGVARIGRTLCLNPGSGRAAGRLRGALVTLERDEVVAHELVAG